MNQNQINELSKLHEMYSKGLINDEEFSVLKAQIMHDNTDSENTDAPHLQYEHPSIGTPAQTPQPRPALRQRIAKRMAWMDDDDKVLALVLICACISMAVTIGYGFLYEHDRDSRSDDNIMSLTSSDPGKATSCKDSIASVAQAQTVETDFDSVMSEDKDMDESTWRVGEQPCKQCHGTGQCSMCGGKAGPFSNTSGMQCIRCGNSGFCSKCKGARKFAIYKDIAIGSRHWRYSKRDKLRAAQKAMMRKAYDLSHGESARPRHQYTYTPIEGGFIESFTINDTPSSSCQYIYSVQKCTACNGAKCSACYNGYVYKNIRKYRIGNGYSSETEYVNGVMTNSTSTPDNITISSSTSSSEVSGGGGSGSAGTGRTPCTNCGQTGNVILNTHAPALVDDNDKWFCNTCRQHLRFLDYHVHRKCTICKGDGFIDERD